MNAIEKISQDIILNILSRLPLKSLMQCKCVSKRWYSLINDPILAELHLQRLKCDSINLVICQYRPSRTVWEIQIYKLDNENHPQLSSSLKTNIEDISSVYSCEGLICISGSAGIHICNPSTRELVTLPRSNSLKESFMHGFGYSPNTKEYKVVQLMHNKLIDGCSRLLSKFEVLTLGTKLWRPIGNVPYVLHPEKKSITLNGIMYWLTYTKKRGFDSQEEIATFNVGDERFGAISGPPDCQAFESMSAISLGVLQGTLCLTCDHFGRRVINHKLEIWMLRDDSVCGWIKQYSIDTSLWKIHRPCNIFPLYHWKGKMLLEDLFSGLLWYDPGTNTFEENLRCIDCFFPCVCMESLMPLLLLWPEFDAANLVKDALCIDSMPGQHLQQHSCPVGCCLQWPVGNPRTMHLNLQLNKWNIQPPMHASSLMVCSAVTAGPGIGLSSGTCPSIMPPTSDMGARTSLSS